MSSHNMFQVMQSEFLTQNQIKNIFTKMLTDIYIRDLHNDIRKPFYNGGLENVFDSVTHKFLISDTALRSIIPPKVSKMTPRLCQIFGCDIFIIPKDMWIDLNIFRTNPVYYIYNISLMGYSHATVN